MELVLSGPSQRSLAQITQSPRGAYLLIGPRGVGKYTALRKALGEIVSEPSDIYEVTSEKPSIGIDSIHDLRRELQLSKPAGNIRAVIIDNAETLTREAQNALLKTLEEPPLNTVIVLIATSQEGLLPTLRSRTKKLHFTEPEPKQIHEYMHAAFKLSPKQISELLVITHNKIGPAVYLANDPGALVEAKEAYVKVKKFAQGSLFERLVLVSELSDAPEFTFETLITSLQKALRAAAAQGEQGKARRLARTLNKMTELMSYIKQNGNTKLALDLAALQLEAK